MAMLDGRRGTAYPPADLDEPLGPDPLQRREVEGLGAVEKRAPWPAPWRTPTANWEGTARQKPGDRLALHVVGQVVGVEVDNLATYRRAREAVAPTI